MGEFEKKLENLKIPESGIPQLGKSEARRAALLSFQAGGRMPAVSFSRIFWIGAPSFVVLALGIFLAQGIAGGAALAQARNILERDVLAGQILSSGGEIKEIKIINKRAFALIDPGKSSESNEFSAVIAEVDLKQKKVAGLENMKVLTEISKKEKKEAMEIAASQDEQAQKALSVSPEVKMAPQNVEMKLKRYNGKFKVEVITKDILIEIQEKGDNDKWVGVVNIPDRSVKEVKIEDVRPASVPSPSSGYESPFPDPKK